MALKKGKLGPRYRLHLSGGTLSVYDPYRELPHQWAEHEAGRRLVAYDGLLAACRRLVRGAACTCADGGAGFVCDVCEGRAAVARAEGT